MWSGLHCRCRNMQKNKKLRFDFFCFAKKVWKNKQRIMIQDHPAPSICVTQKESQTFWNAHPLLWSRFGQCLVSETLPLFPAPPFCEIQHQLKYKIQNQLKYVRNTKWASIRNTKWAKIPNTKSAKMVLPLGEKQLRSSFLWEPIN